MPPIIVQEKCIGCGACVAVCPTKALEMDEDNIAELIVDKCVDDWSCIPVCPTEAVLRPPEDFKVEKRVYTEKEIAEMGMVIRGTSALWKKK